jgi:subtilisin family serine protease
MKKQILITSLAVALAACGGGGGSDSASSTDPVPGPVSDAVEANHLKAINADYASDRSITGAGVTVAVLDSGVNVNHDEFAGKTLNQNSASFSTPANPSDTSSTGPQEDVHGHGTHVTGMVWGENVGVAPGADLLMLDIYEEFTPDSSAAKGLIDDLAGYGVDFANASLSGVDYFNVDSELMLDERPVFEPLNAGGIGWIVAAGNFGLDMTELFITNPIDCGPLTQAQRDESLVCEYVFDATIAKLLVKDTTLRDNTLWVGAVDVDTFEISVFQPVNGFATASNVPGGDPEIQARWISAPGQLLTGPLFSDNSSYIRVSGTSQAAPLVTGAAALVRSQFPTLSNEAVLQVLLDTADDTFAGYDVTKHGQGVLDIAAALQVDASLYIP